MLFTYVGGVYGISLIFFGEIISYTTHEINVDRKFASTGLVGNVRLPVSSFALHIAPLNARVINKIIKFILTNY